MKETLAFYSGYGNTNKEICKRLLGEVFYYFFFSILWVIILPYVMAYNWGKL